MNMTSMLRTVGNALEVKRMMNGVRHIDPDDLLHRIGLERRRSAMDVVLPALGFFAVGALIGAGVAVLVTPSSGPEVRRKIAKAATDAKGRVESLIAGGGEEEPEEEDESAQSSPRNGGRSHRSTSA